MLELPPRSDSLHFRAYTEPLAQGSLLDWAVRRLRRAGADASDVYIWALRADADRVDKALGEGARATFWPSSGGGSLQDLEALARTAAKARLLVVDITAALLPLDVLERFERHHTENGHPATILTQLPCVAPPILVEADFLSSLMVGLPGLPPHVLPRDLRLALAGIERAVQAAGKRAPLRLGRMAQLSAEAQAERGWPYAVPLDSPDDVEVLRRVLERCAAGDASPEMPAEPLDHWTEMARRHRGARLADLRAHARGPLGSGAVAHRILYVQSPSAFTGVEQVLVQLAAGIGREHAVPFEVAALIAIPGTLTDRLAQAGVDVRIARREFAQNSVEHFLYSRRLLDEVNPALVHAHTVAGVPFGCAVAEREVPFVQHVHIAQERGLRLLADQISVASAVIAVSDFVRRRLIRLGADADKVHVIRNGIRLPPAEETADDAQRAAVRSRIRQACGVAEAAPLVLLVARFAANKRHDVALDAFARLRSRLRAAHLVMAGEAFAGDGPVVEAAERQIERLRIRDRVHRLGFWRDMPSLYAAADVLLLPSEDDPLPLTVLEAMSAGVPVVAARSGGTPEMIESGSSGLLVEPGNGEGFAAALAQVLTDEERRTSLIEGGLAHCRAEFSLSRFVGEVRRLYQHVLTGEPMAAGDV